MISSAFDNQTDGRTSPEKFYGKKDKICDVCIIIFCTIVLNNILKTFKCEKIAEMVSANGSIPFLKLNYKGKVIIPTEAYRDEGFSYDYVPAATILQ